MARVLIIDDDAAFRNSLAETLHALGHDPLEVDNGADALLRWRELRPDLIFLDFRMQHEDGLDVLRRLRREYPQSKAPVIMLTAYASADNTIDAMSLGAFDHLLKPIGRDQVRDVVERSLKSTTQDDDASNKAGAQSEVRDSLIGQSPRMREVQKLIGMAAGSDASVLIGGETGTGKELVARLLHRASSRAEGPFVAVNCASIPAELIESELFGHVRGAYTGAISARRGCFREADGGTLLLDEIGDMPLSMQAKILRALQEREVTPLGADKPLPIDVRVIAATHHDLHALVDQGRFRQDLYFRLAIVPVVLPALRDRPQDIPVLAEHFLRVVGTGAGKKLAPAAIERLLAYAWPGNVRELRNVMERLAVIVRGRSIEADDLDFLYNAKKDTGSQQSNSLYADLLQLPMGEAIAALERVLIQRALAAANGNRAEAARQLGIHRQLLYSKIKQYALE